MSSRPRTPEDYLPPTAALFAYMLIPSAILFVAGLTTTVLLSNFHHSYDCHERVNAYLWGGVILFYLWTLFHFTVLFGPPSWLRPLSLKLALTGIIAVAFGCWIAMGHFGSVFHFTTVADLACMYSFFACMFGTLIVSALGGCRSVPECDEDIYDRATQPTLSGASGGGVYAPGAGIQTSALRSRRVQVASNSQLHRDADPASPSHAASQSSAPQPPLSPHPQIEMMETPKVGGGGRAGGGGAGGIDARMELRAIEREVLQGGSNNGALNQQLTPSQQPRSQYDLDADREYDHLAVRDAERMPLTPKMH